MVNESELLINVVMHNKPKVLRGLNQKVCGQAQRVNGSLTWLLLHRRKRQHLTYSGTHAERGKPVTLPPRESEPQGEPMGSQVWDSRKSERHLVMRWIVSADTLRKQADFGVGLSGREQMRNPLQAGKQMWAVTSACAPATAAVDVEIIVKYRAGSGCSYRVSSEAFERLEPCAVKVARTVLRRGSGSNITLLSDLYRAYRAAHFRFNQVIVTICADCIPGNSATSSACLFSRAAELSGDVKLMRTFSYPNPAKIILPLISMP